MTTRARKTTRELFWERVAMVLLEAGSRKDALEGLLSSVHSPKELASDLSRIDPGVLVGAERAMRLVVPEFSGWEAYSLSSGAAPRSNIPWPLQFHPLRDMVFAAFHVPTNYIVYDTPPSASGFIPRLRELIARRTGGGWEAVREVLCQHVKQYATDAVESAGFPGYIAGQLKEIEAGNDEAAQFSALVFTESGIHEKIVGSFSMLVELVVAAYLLGDADSMSDSGALLRLYAVAPILAPANVGATRWTLLVA